MLACPFLGPMLVSRQGVEFPLRATSATGVRVAAAFGRALADDAPATLGELRAATVAFAAILRAEGRTPEEVLIALKRTIERSGWWPSLVPPRRARWEQQPPEFHLYLRVFGWFLAGYFGTR